MRADNEQIDPLELGMVLVNSIIGVGILVVPSRSAKFAGSAAWLSVLLGGIVAFVIVWLFARLAQRFPSQTIIEINRELLGGFFGALGGLIAILLWLISSSFVLRTFGEINRDFLLPETPIEVTIVGLLLAGGFLARKGLEPLARMSQIALPISIVLGLSIFLLSLPGSDSSNLLPLWGKGGKGIALGAANVTFAFIGYEILFLLVPYTTKPKAVKKTGLWAIGVVNLLYLAVTLIALVVFGSCSTAKMLWPTLLVARTIDLPGFFLTRVDVFVYTVWLMQVFLQQSISIYILSLSLARFFKIKEQKLFVWPLLPVLYFFALFPLNIAQLSTFNTAASISVTVYFFLLTVLLSILSRRRERSA